MASRFLFASIGVCVLAACAAGSSDDPAGTVTDDGSAVGPEGGTTEEAGGSTTGPTGSTGPGVFDSGPPATVGSGEDAGTEPDASEDSAAPPPANGACTSLSQCPYGSAAGVEGVACEDGGCVITCNGENYDVNGVLTDGCEVPGAAPDSNGSPIGAIDDHTQAKAASVGSFDCSDGDSAQDLTGAVLSDYRVHSPAVDSFDMVTGSAPQFFTMIGTGSGICENDANFTLNMTTPSDHYACYTLTLVTDKSGTQTCNTDGTGSCSISNGSGSYGDNSTIYVSVSKQESCLAATTNDNGSFKLTGHL